MMDIKILGTGCAKCKKLESMVRDLVSEEKLDANVQKIEDIMEIMNYGTMSIPALVIDEKVVLKGYVPNRDELLELITQKS